MDLELHLWLKVAGILILIVTAGKMRMKHLLILSHTTSLLHYNKNKLPLDRVLRTAEAAKKEAPQANIVIQIDRETPAFAVEELIDTVRPVLTAPPCISTDEA